LSLLTCRYKLTGKILTAKDAKERAARGKIFGCGYSKLILKSFSALVAEVFQ
jgi:hypothetical protein